MLWRRLQRCTAVLLACLAATAAEEQDIAWREAVASGDRALEARDYETAEEHFQHALSYAEEFGADPRTVDTLVRLARAHRRQGDFAKPETLYHQALRIAKTAFGESSPEYARVLNEVGRYYHTRRKYDQAEEYYKKAFGMRVRALGREHADVADSISNLGVLFENQARHDKAAIYYQTALEIREKTLGLEHPQTVASMEHFARLLRKLQRVPEAEELEAKARPLREEWVRRMSGQPVDLDPVAEMLPGMEPPKLKEKTEPQYTEEARIARHEGRVVLRGDISAEGQLHNIRLLQSLGLGLDERAVGAVRQWQFRPARKNGDKVPFRATLEINFRLL